MSSLRLDVEVTTVEPASGEMVYVEARGADGAQVALYLAASAVRGSSLAAGQRLQLALELPAAAPALPPLRERMGRPAASAGAPPPTRTPAQVPPRAAATAPPRANGAPPRTDPSAVILSSILGTPGDEDVVSARDVDDEMDALLGRTKRG